MVFLLKIVILLHMVPTTLMNKIGREKWARRTERAVIFRAVVTQFHLFITAQRGLTMSRSPNTHASVKGRLSID